MYPAAFKWMKWVAERSQWWWVFFALDIYINEKFFIFNWINAELSLSYYTLNFSHFCQTHSIPTLLQQITSTSHPFCDRRRKCPSIYIKNKTERSSLSWKLEAYTSTLFYRPEQILEYGNTRKGTGVSNMPGKCFDSIQSQRTTFLILQGKSISSPNFFAV